MRPSIPFTSALRSTADGSGERQEILEHLLPPRKAHLPGGEAQMLKGRDKNAAIQRLASLQFLQGRACLVQTVRCHVREDLQILRILGEGCFFRGLEDDRLRLGCGGRLAALRGSALFDLCTDPGDQGFGALGGGVRAPGERIRSSSLLERLKSPAAGPEDRDRAERSRPAPGRSGPRPHGHTVRWWPARERVHCP